MTLKQFKAKKTKETKKEHELRFMICQLETITLELKKICEVDGMDEELFMQATKMKSLSDFTIEFIKEYEDLDVARKLFELVKEVGDK